MDQPSRRERFFEISFTSPLVKYPNIYSYFLSQNAGIREGKMTGINLNLQVIGIGDGLTV